MTHPLTEGLLYYVYKYDLDDNFDEWCEPDKELLYVTESFDRAADLVDDYSERFPHAYFDYETNVQEINSKRVRIHND